MAKKLAFDKILFTTIWVLVAIGLTMVYSAGAAVARGQDRGISTFLVKQGSAALLGLIAMWVVMHIDYRHLRRPLVAWGGVAGALILLVAVLFSPELNSSQRWLFVGGLSLQPAELAKLALIAFIAYQIDRHMDSDIDKDLLIPCVLVSAAMAALILMQPDLGTVVLLAVSVSALLFIAGVRWRYFFAGILLAAPALYLLIFKVAYRRQRLLSFLDPARDPLGTGYQANQSLIALGSGGVDGVGLGDSLQKLHFLPHPHSDFVFSIVGEELGLVGTMGVLMLFAVFLWRGVRAGAKAPDELGRFLAWGLCGVVVLQALLHMSVALALVPTKGIPLPFISYGGSSLLVSLVASGVVLNVSQHG